MYYIRNTSISEVAKVKCGKSYFLCKWPLVRQRSRGMVIMSSPSDMPSLARSPRPLDSPSSSVELDITRGWGARPQVLSCFTHTPLADSHSKNLLFNFIFGSRSISRSLNIEELKWYHCKNIVTPTLVIVACFLIPHLRTHPLFPPKIFASVQGAIYRHFREASFSAVFVYLLALLH